ASAGRADDRARSRCGAGAGACGADDRDRERNAPRDSARRLEQLDLDLDREIGPARATGAAADAEEIVAEKGCEQVVEAAEVELGPREAPCAETGVPRPGLTAPRRPRRPLFVAPH